jgi:hypothetical protein
MPTATVVFALFSPVTLAHIRLGGQEVYQMYGVTALSLADLWCARPEPLMVRSTLNSQKRCANPLANMHRGYVAGARQKCLHLYGIIRKFVGGFGVTNAPNS